MHPEDTTSLFPRHQDELVVLGSDDTWIAPADCEVIHAGRLVWDHVLAVRYADGRQAIIVFDNVDPFKIRKTIVP